MDCGGSNANKTANSWLRKRCWHRCSVVNTNLIRSPQFPFIKGIIVESSKVHISLGVEGHACVMHHGDECERQPAHDLSFLQHGHTV